MEIVIAVIVLGIIALLCGVMLTVASKFMSVEVDERIPQVRACLPGANCGACGFAGCDGYAAALVEDPDLAVTLCVPGGASAADQIGTVLGRSGGAVEKVVAEVRCSGTCEATSVKMDYNGIESCSGAKLLFGGTGACVYGCIGLGDCAKVCPVSAITVTGGLAKVDPSVCIGCSKCVKTCPNDVIAMRPANVHVVVDCVSHQKGAGTRKACTAGCIGCKMCERNCHTGAITVTDNLSSIDYAKCDGCGKCIEVCPTNCLVGLNLAVKETPASAEA
jgi:Na+-translocating ferredoxin:NAD+ oxidoreductase RNF subunit RnfB